VTRPYVMALCQFAPKTAFLADGRLSREILDENITRCCELVRRAADEHQARLVVFPQFGLTGYAPGLSVDQWEAASLTLPGPETERLAEAARTAGAYVVVQAAERHPAFPGRYFLSAAILTPEGQLDLTYRKHYTLSTRTSPIDVLDRFVRTFGDAALYPVLDTPLGRLGVVIGAEPHWPEAGRALALRGAEVILNPIAAAPVLDYLQRPAAAFVRAVRAFENVAYFGVANIGLPGASAPPSQAYDYEGREIGQAPDGADGFALATIDIEALRAARRAPAANLVAEIQPDIHRGDLALALWPANTFAERRLETWDDIVALERQTLSRLEAAGRLPPPKV
jgi:predicted amidohydrolase